jgi:pyruvate-ferredoxin/flavodoxin oxidoreductase
MDALRREYEAKLADLHASYPQQIARRLAQRILAAGTGKALVDLLGDLPDAELPPVSAPPAPPEPAAAIAVPAIVSAPAPAAVATEEDDLAMEPYVETARCTSCNECTNLNGRLFAYNADKQAYIKDPRGGTFAQLVQAAERCPAAIIHPGTPLNPREKDLEKWVKRAAPFN